MTAVVVKVIEYTPGVSSFFGIIRMAVGAVDIVAGVVFSAIFLQKDPLVRTLGGVKNIVRGCVLTVPIVGNLAVLIYDLAISFFFLRGGLERFSSVT